MMNVAGFLRWPKHEPLFASGFHRACNESHAAHPVPSAKIRVRRLNTNDNLVNIYYLGICLTMCLACTELVCEGIYGRPCIINLSSGHMEEKGFWDEIVCTRF